MGFELPFVEWMSNDLKPLFLDLLNSNDARLLFSKSYLKSLNKSLKSNNPQDLCGLGGFFYHGAKTIRLNYYNFFYYMTF